MLRLIPQLALLRYIHTLMFGESQVIQSRTSWKVRAVKGKGREESEMRNTNAHFKVSLREYVVENVNNERSVRFREHFV